jgi:hypothetical protein
MVIYGSYMFEFSVSKDMTKKDIIREVAVGKVAAYLCRTLIVKELKISVEHGRVVTTLNIIKLNIIFCVVLLCEEIHYHLQLFPTHIISPPSLNGIVDVMVGSSYSLPQISSHGST